MLAVVEHDQELSGTQPLDGARRQRHADARRDPERRRDHLRHRVTVLRGRELADPGAVPVLRHDLGRDLQREPGLADAAHARECDEPRRLERVGDCRELPLASDERRDLRQQVPWVAVERVQRRERRRQARCDDLEDALGSGEVTEGVLAEVEERGAAWEAVARQLLSGVREQDLSAVRGGHEASGAVHRRPVVVAISVLRRAGVHAHAHS